MMMTIATRMLRLGAAVLFACLTTATAVAGPGDGTVLGATKIADNGPNSLRWNLAVIAEGFTSSQQELFNAYAQQVVDEIYNRPQLQTYIPAINVIRLNVASNQSGADDPLECGGSGIFVNTYFDASFCSGGIQRALVANSALCTFVLNTWVPEWDVAVVLVNSPIYGGTGGQVAVFSVASGWREVFVHELGHSAFGLGDEYEYWAGCGIDTDQNFHPSYEPSVPNSTIQTNRALIKWRDLILPATPVPTTINANCADCDYQGNPLPPSTIGLYEGADYYHCGAYRPRYDCLMRALGYDFCPVCLREVDRVLTPYMATHVNLTIHSADPPSDVSITVSPPDTNNLSNGTAPFVRTYPRPSTVALRAPSLAGGNNFAKWRRDGTDYSIADSISLYLDRNTTMTAAYLSCTVAVGQPWITPPGPRCVNTIYTVTWNRLAGATSHEIRENGGTWQNTAGDTTKEFSNTAGGNYSYEVRAVSACGQGSVSPPLTVMLESTVPAVPGQPSLDPPGPVCVNGEYSVHWAPVSGAIRYEVRENSGVWQDAGPAAVWYCVNSVAGDYTYEVRGLNVCGPGSPSPSVTMTVATEGVLPGVPGQPWVQPLSPVCVNRQYTVRWNPVPGAEYYQIRENEGMWRSSVATMWGDVKYSGGTYSYEVRALNGCGQSAPGPSVIVTVGSCYSLVVFSSDPVAGVLVTVNPADQDGRGSGSTPFARTYGSGALVSLQAPDTVGGKGFQKWLRDGADYSTQPAVTLNVDASRIMTASYAACSCLSQGDINGDGVINVTDVIEVIKVAFSNGTDIQDPQCPKTRSDVTGNGAVDVNDVLYLIGTAFLNGPNPVNPCGP